MSEEMSEERLQDLGLARWRFERQLGELAQRIDAAIAQDEQPYGRFTRAYLRVLPAVLEAFLVDADWRDSGVDGIWRGWLIDQMALHGEGENDPNLVAVRFAVDGLVLSSSIGCDPENTGSLFELLERMTRQPQSAH